MYVNNRGSGVLKRKINRDSEHLANTNLYLNDELADVHFIFKNDDNEQKVPASKQLLAALSPVFKAMFFGPLKEADIVDISDASVGAFKEFLKYFYFRSVILSMENMKEVFYLIEKYDILKPVMRSVNVTMEDDEQKRSELDVWYFQMVSHIKMDCYREDVLSHCEPIDLITADNFKRLDPEMLEDFLELGVLESIPEVVIFDAVITWAKYRCQLFGVDASGTNIRNQLGDCLKSIRYKRMSAEQFSRVVSSFPGLITLEEFQEIVFISTLRDYEPRIFNRMSRWNGRDYLYCDLKPNIHKKQLRHNPEMILFSSNRPLLFKELDTGNFPCKYLPSINDIDVVITEIDTTNGLRTERYRGIHRTDGSCAVGGLLILPKPLLIDPRFQYEICTRISLDNSRIPPRDDDWKVKWEKYTIDMEDDIKIEIQQDSETFGWLEQLRFNKLD